MYLLFRYHDIMPSQWHDMGYGERTILKGFIRKEMEDRQKEIDALKGSD